MTNGRAFFHRHYWFWVLLILFVSFRLYALLLMRPGGFIADNSDYEFYYAWGQTVPMGYTTFVNLWTAYPPLFPALMLPVFELSSRVPPWVEPRLAFHVLFGLELLIFETGNLILIYRLARRLAPGQAAVNDSVPQPAANATLPAPGYHPLLPPILYALMFVPVYTLLGWFEAMPLFFLLLALDLLLTARAWGWIGSAVAAALGFLVKLTPILLVPVAVRWLGLRLSWQAARREWFRRGPGGLLRPLAYVVIFGLVAVGVGLPLARFNPTLALSSFRVNSIRPPWQSVWALIDGYYGFGLVPVDMRNLQGYLRGGQWQTTLPWALITVGFLALYLWLYTRRYDWRQPRTPVAFTAASIIWLFLYSKGWSPQFVVWIIAFLVLLLPTLRGVLLAVTLTAINFVEAQVFLILLPDEHWLMVITVLARTALLILLAVEFLGQIWPGINTGRRLRTAAARADWVMIGLLAAALVVGTPRLAQAYTNRRLAELPCRPAVEVLRGDTSTPRRVIATTQPEVWRDLYPWLHDSFDLHVVDGYDPNDRPAVEVIGDKLAQLAQAGEFWWIEMPGAGGEWSAAAATFFARPGVHLVDDQTLGACRAARVIALDAGRPRATAAAAGGPIKLLAARTGAASGKDLSIVLYWQADSPVTASYTVFTQLFGTNGQLLAQQDNLPVQGLAPTNTWKPGAVLRDPYRLKLPETTPPGPYTLRIGLYDAAGRRPFQLNDGTTADHVTLTIEARP